LKRIKPLAGAAVVVLSGLGAADGDARATEQDWGLNGTFRAESNGVWAQTNQSYRDESSVSQIWTISTTCNNPTDCVGEVTSDQGWTAEITQTSGLWHVERTLPAWEHCQDGTAADGLQHYKFFPISAVTQQVDASQSDLFAGQDETKGTSGACGVNKPLVISMPFRMTRIG
jgi:hypothetical protein